MKPKVTTTYWDDDSEAKMLFSNGTYLRVVYKFIKPEEIIFVYDFKCMSGVMKIKPCWCSVYDDILGQAECALPYLFMPSIFKYFYNVQLERKTTCETVLKLWSEGKVKEIEKLNWTSYYGFNEKSAKEIKKSLKIQERIIKELNNIIYE